MCMTDCWIYLRSSLLFLALGLLTFGREKALAGDKSDFPSEWKRIDQLIQDQKLREAESGALDLLKSAKTANDADNWTRALLKISQLKVGLHSYEEAAHFLKSEPRPAGLTHQTILSLYYARILETYLNAYDWEIRQREKSTGAQKTLKQWTAAEIYQEALAALVPLWQSREKLGSAAAPLLQEFIEKGNYPKNIRTSWRDTITYLIADLLANSGHWSIENTNELSKLDPITWLTTQPPALVDGDLAKESLHPLARLVAVLKDLERWHAARKEPEAALEAHLTMVRHIDSVWSSGADLSRGNRLALYLEGYLHTKESVPWWSMGMGQLASMLQSRDELVKAHRVASEGLAKYPSTPGAEQCKSIVQQIEFPHYAVTAMPADGTERRSIEIQHSNLKKIYFRAYPLDFLKEIESSQTSYYVGKRTELLQELLKKPAPMAWTTELPDLKDFRSHKTYVTTPLKNHGLYTILVSARPDFQEAENTITGVSLLITDIAILEADGSNKHRNLMVVDAQSGAPLAGIPVRLYSAEREKNFKLSKTLRTDNFGQIQIPKAHSNSSSNSKSKFNAAKPYQEDHAIIVAQRGDAWALSTHRNFYGENSADSTKQETLLFTDRGIYRPGQKIFWKVLAYEAARDQGRFKNAAGAAVTVSLHDTNGKEVDQVKIVANEFGTAAGTFEIPQGRALGPWHLRTNKGNQRASFRVEEYKRPTFEAKIRPPSGTVRLDQPLTIKGEARYYNGMALSEGKANWRVVRTALFPWWWNWIYFNLGGGEREEVVQSGTTSLAADGTFQATFTPTASSAYEGMGSKLVYSFRMVVDVLSSGGENKTTSLQFKVGRTDVTADLTFDRGLYLANEKVQVRIARTDLNGNPLPGSGKYRLLKVKEPTQFLSPAEIPLPPAPGTMALQTPGDKQRPRWSPDYSPEGELARWSDGDEIISQSVSHDEKGAATVDLPPLAAGVYRLRYETADKAGGSFDTWKEIVVAAKEGSKPETSPQIPLGLFVEKDRVLVGEKMRVLVAASGREQTVILMVTRRGKPHERRVLNTKDLGVIEFSITDEDRGTIVLTASAMIDHQFIQLTKSVFVPWDQKDLKVEITRVRDRLTPGSQESISLAVAGPKAQPAAAEVLAYMYDKSLDFFTGHRPHGIESLTDRIFPAQPKFPRLFYDARPVFGSTFAGSGFTNFNAWSPFQPDYLKLDMTMGSPSAVGGLGSRRSGRGIPMMHMQAPAAASVMESDAGGVDRRSINTAKASTIAKALPAESDQVTASTAGQDSGGDIDIRKDFRETPFFMPKLRTDAKGQLTFEFEVPDSLTTWSLWLLALTQDLKSGVAHRELVAAKQLMVKPYLPRFLREGDQGELRVVVQNSGDAPLTGRLEIQISDEKSGKDLSELLGLKDGQKDLARTFTVEGGKESVHTFSLKVPESLFDAVVK
ncbi:hypothetical protein E3A20_01980, partial [Planctomyces bekefii]